MLNEVLHLFCHRCTVNQHDHRKLETGTKTPKQITRLRNYCVIGLNVR